MIPRVEFAHNLEANSKTHLLCCLNSVMVFALIVKTEPVYADVVGVFVEQPAQRDWRRKILIRQTFHKYASCLVVDIEPYELKASLDLLTSTVEECDDDSVEEVAENNDYKLATRAELLVICEAYNLVLTPNARRSPYVVKLLKDKFQLSHLESRHIVFDAPLPYVFERVFNRIEALQILVSIAAGEHGSIPADAVGFKPAVLS